jgi:ABC-type Fe3+ transport system substrate-binding protein
VKLHRITFTGVRAILLSLSAAIALAGCGGNSTSTNSSPGQTSTAGASGTQLTIISPHPTDTQVEFETAFQAQNPGVDIKWLDQGGSTDDLNFVLTQFKGKKAGEGIGIDIFFGGGVDTFIDLETAGVLQALPSDYGVPADLNGVPLRGKNNTWVAAALGGFGILVNKTIAQRDNLPMPATWADLADPRLRDRIALADPRHSGSAHMAYEIILQANGWEKGWQVLTAMTGNARSYGNSASALLDDVSSGEAVIAPAIDFYANSKIATAGAEKLAYVAPRGQRVTTPDPIALLRDGPNPELARKFIAFVMSPAGQKIWMLEKGAPGGPKNSALYRSPAVPASYKPLPAQSLIRINPYEGKNDFVFDPQKSALRRRALDDLLGAVLIDNQNAVKARWKANPDAAKLTLVPVTEAELLQLAPRWSDQNFRNAQISKWKQAARKHFGS